MSLTARPLRRWLDAPAPSTFICLSQGRNVHRLTPAQCGAHFVFFGAKQGGSQPLLAAAGFSAPRGCQARFVPNALLYVFDAFGKYQEQDWDQFIETAQQRWDSPVWTATHIGNLLLSAHHKVAFTVEIHVAATPLPIPDVTPHFPHYHSWTAAERKRPLGTPISAPPSRRLVTSRWAATAGTQLRRTAALPLLRTEVEPGEAIRHLTHQVHSAASGSLCLIIGVIALWPFSLNLWRCSPQVQMRSYGITSSEMSHLGALHVWVSHIALWKEMLVESRSKDRHLIASLLRGFPLLGAIQAGYEWETLDPRPDTR